MNGPEPVYREERAVHSAEVDEFRKMEKVLKKGVSSKDALPFVCLLELHAVECEMDGEYCIAYDIDLAHALYTLTSAYMHRQASGCTPSKVPLKASISSERRFL